MNQIHNFIKFYESDAFYGRSLNSIEDLKTYLEDKLFIVVGGGIGSGKTYFVDNTLKKVVGDLLTFDVDAINRELGGGVYKRELAGQALARMRKGLEQSLRGKQSVIFSGTNSKYEALVKRLQIAKENNFTTILIHIDVPLEQALKQNKERASTGIHPEVPEEKLVRTNKNSKEVFDKVKKDRNLVDFYYQVKR